MKEIDYGEIARKVKKELKTVSSYNSTLVIPLRRNNTVHSLEINFTRDVSDGLSTDPFAAEVLLIDKNGIAIDSARPDIIDLSDIERATDDFVAEIRELIDMYSYLEEEGREL